MLRHQHTSPHLSTVKPSPNADCPCDQTQPGEVNSSHPLRSRDASCEFIIIVIGCRDGSVSTATRYRGSNPGVGEGRFSVPVKTDPASFTMGTGGFPGLKRPGRGVDHPPPSSAEVKERIELYLCSPSGPSWPVIG